MNPQEYMRKVFRFLELPEPNEEQWLHILRDGRANINPREYEPMMIETEKLLRDFYQPFNDILVKLLDDERYRWDAMYLSTTPHVVGNVMKFKPRPFKRSHSQSKHSDEQHHDPVVSVENISQSKQLEEQHHDPVVENVSQSKQSEEQHHDPVVENVSQSKQSEEEPHDPVASKENISQSKQLEEQPHDPVSSVEKEEKLKFKRAHRNPDDLHGAVPRDHLDPVPKESMSAKKAPNTRLRGGGDDSGSVVLNPRAFNTSDLPFPYDEPEPQFNEWIRKVVFRGAPIESNEHAAHLLCLSSFALDVAAVKYLIYDLGVPVNLPYAHDANRTPLHCLALVEVLGDANSKSYIFPMLKNKVNWLTPILDPPLPRKSHIPMASDIVASLENPAVKIAKWLFRAGADTNIRDKANNTALHFAAYGGMSKLVKCMLEHGAEVNVQNREGRTPMHNALAMGYVKVASMLLDAGANLDTKDMFGVSCRDMIVNPGPVPKHEASFYFNLTQRDVRKIDRIPQPELHPEDPRGWKHGTGGWGPERLEWVGDEMRCDMDQYWAHEITGDDIFDKYLARSSPVLIRGLIDDWPIVKEMTVDTLLQNHGDKKVYHFW